MLNIIILRNLAINTTSGGISVFFFFYLLNYIAYLSLFIRHKSAILNETAMRTKRENYTNAIIDTISNNVRVRQRKSRRNHPINEIPNFQ